MAYTILIWAVWVAVVAAIGSMAYAAWLAAPWVPSRGRSRQAILDALAINSGERLYDLGCGDGWLVCAAARKGARAVGYEISLPIFAFARIRAFFFSGPGTAAIECRDFWRVNLSDADVVFVFLTPKAMGRLHDKLTAECRPGTRVVSYVFSIAGWTPERTIKAVGQHAVYIYRLPVQTAVENTQT